jgi:hypothetical protein
MTRARSYLAPLLMRLKTALSIAATVVVPLLLAACKHSHIHL